MRIKGNKQTKGKKGKIKNKTKQQEVNRKKWRKKKKIFLPGFESMQQTTPAHEVNSDHRATLALVNYRGNIIIFTAFFHKHCFKKACVELELWIRRLIQIQALPDALFPETKNFTPLCLYSLACINGYR